MVLKMTQSVRILYLTTAELWGVCSLGLFTVEAGLRLCVSSLMKENILWQSQVTQIIRESSKIDLEIQIPGTLYFLSKSLARIFPNIFPCIIFRMR